MMAGEGDEDLLKKYHVDYIQLPASHAVPRSRARACASPRARGAVRGGVPQRSARRARRPFSQDVRGLQCRVRESGMARAQGALVGPAPRRWTALGGEWRGRPSAPWQHTLASASLLGQAAHPPGACAQSDAHATHPPGLACKICLGPSALRVLSPLRRAPTQRLQPKSQLSISRRPRQSFSSMYQPYARGA